MSNNSKDDSISLSDIENNITSPKTIVRRFSKTAEELKDYLLTKYPHGFSLDNIIDVVVECIQYLALYRKMSGHQKRNAITEAIILVYDETNVGELDVFEPIIKAVVPATVNTLIDVEKKKIKLNKKAFRLCCCCYN